MFCLPLLLRLDELRTTYYNSTDHATWFLVIMSHLNPFVSRVGIALMVMSSCCFFKKGWKENCVSLGRDHLQRNKLRLEIMGIRRDYILAYSWTPRIAIVGVAAISTHPHGPRVFTLSKSNTSCLQWIYRSLKSQQMKFAIYVGIKNSTTSSSNSSTARDGLDG